MKVQISKAFKGELFIRAKNKTFKQGTKIHLSDEEFYDSFTQSLISKGWLVPLEEYERGQQKLIRLRSRKNNPMVFQVIKRAVNPNEIFYLPADQFGNGQIQQALEAGFIVEESLPGQDGDNTQDVSEVSSKKKPLDSKSSTKLSSETSSKTKKLRSIKRVASSEESESPTEKVALKRKSRTTGKEPENAFVYRPENVEINEPPVSIDLDDDLGDIFVDSDQQAPDVAFIDEKQKAAEKITFVDKEQRKARAQHGRRNQAENNEETQ